MYAIVQHGGHQYRVGPGDRLLVNRLDAEVGTVVALEPVLFVADGDGSAGQEAVETGARVAATVVSHRRGAKLRVFRYKPKKRYRRTMGYRSQLTELLIEAVVARGEKLPTASTVVKAVSPPAEARPGTKRARGSGQEASSPASDAPEKSGASETAGTAPAPRPRAKGEKASGGSATPEAAKASTGAAAEAVSDADGAETGATAEGGDDGA